MQSNPQWEMTPPALKHVVESVMSQTQDILIVVSGKSSNCVAVADNYSNITDTNNTVLHIFVYKIQIYLALFNTFKVYI